MYLISKPDKHTNTNKLDPIVDLECPLVMGWATHFHVKASLSFSITKLVKIIAVYSQKMNLNKTMHNTQYLTLW